MVNRERNPKMPTELSTARTLVKTALSLGYTISYYDGEDWAVMGSSSETLIMSQLRSTDEEVLRFEGADGKTVGKIWLVWGNAEDGSELCSDYTDNDATRELIDKVEATHNA